MLSTKQARFLAKGLKTMRQIPGKVKALALHPNTIGTGIAVDLGHTAISNRQQKKSKKDKKSR